MVSLWCASLSTDIRFWFLYFKVNSWLAHMVLHQEKYLPNDSGRPLSYNVILQNWEGKKFIGWAKYVYACKWDMCWRNVCVSSLVTKNIKSRSKIPFFSKWAPFWNLIPVKENNYIFRRKLSQLHEKDTFLHMTFTSPLKQGETRTSSGLVMFCNSGDTPADVQPTSYGSFSFDKFSFIVWHSLHNRSLIFTRENASI